jgi:predicted nucleotidyltransferase
MNNLSDILAKKSQIKQIATQFDARDIAVFGSFSRNEAKPTSDIDFLVDWSSEKTLFDRLDMKYALQKLLGRNVDVITRQGLHWAIKEKILNEAIAL